MNEGLKALNWSNVRCHLYNCNKQRPKEKQQHHTFQSPHKLEIRIKKDKCLYSTCDKLIHEVHAGFWTGVLNFGSAIIQIYLQFKEPGSGSNAIGIQRICISFMYNYSHTIYFLLYKQRIQSSQEHVCISRSLFTIQHKVKIVQPCIATLKKGETKNKNSCVETISTFSFSGDLGTVWSQ